MNPQIPFAHLSTRGHSSTFECTKMSLFLETLCAAQPLGSRLPSHSSQCQNGVEQGLERLLTSKHVSVSLYLHIGKLEPGGP